tara:strand:- start:140 stop:811 length:672 start_codon:yes stop_codon:yes gene_type:complete
MDINNLLEEIYNDISFNESDLNNLKESTNKFIGEELEKINRYLTKSVMDFTKNEIEKMKKCKVDCLNKNINTITESVLSKVSEEYNLDKKKVLEDNKPNLLQINDLDNIYSDNNNNHILDLNESENTVETVETVETIETIETVETNDNTNQTNNKTEVKSNDKKTTKSIKKKHTTQLDNTTENDTYKKHLIEQKKCPIFQKGKYCEKSAKHGHYCGYHKKFNV